jgi:hypothetical protein
MPYSTPVFKNETIDYLVNKFDPSSTILDVGAGAGYYSKLLKGIFPNMDAIEIFEPYIGQYGLKSKYNNVWNENTLYFQVSILAVCCIFVSVLSLFLFSLAISSAFLSKQASSLTGTCIFT